MVQENTVGLEKTISYEFNKADRIMLNFMENTFKDLHDVPNLEKTVKHISSDHVEVPFKGKRYFKQYKSHVRGSVHSNKTQIEFNSKSENEVELWWIQCENRGIGLGTILLNKVLDISDYFGIKITLCPIPLDGGDISKLRTWYASFGFKGNTFSPYMTYTPQKKQN